MTSHERLIRAKATSAIVSRKPSTYRWLMKQKEQKPRQAATAAMTESKTLTDKFGFKIRQEQTSFCHKHFGCPFLESKQGMWNPNTKISLNLHKSQRIKTVTLDNSNRCLLFANRQSCGQIHPYLSERRGDCALFSIKKLHFTVSYQFANIP